MSENTTYSKKIELPEADIAKITGEQDKFIKLIAAVTGVQIAYVGGMLSVSGGEQQVHNTIDVLNSLIELSFTKHISEDDVRSALRMVSNDEKEHMRDVMNGKIKVSGIVKYVSPKSYTQKVYVDSIHENDMIFSYGPAGTGKTFLAVALAVNFYLQKKVQKIILTRPAVEAGEKLGFLPGDLADKVNPYLRPLYDALNAMMEPELVEKLIERGIIEVAPLAFMRGRTLSNAFVILDEAQNTTKAQMKMFLTRLGFGSKAIITGDITQVDLPPEVESGLVDAIGRLYEVEGIKFIKLSDKDVVRHPLVTKIINAYEK